MPHRGSRAAEAQRSPRRPLVVRVGPEICPEKKVTSATRLSQRVCRSHIPGPVADVAASRSRRRSVRLNALRFRCQRPPVRRCITNVQGPTGVSDAQCCVPRRTDASPPPVTTGADPLRMGVTTPHSKCCFPLSVKSRWHNGKMSTMPCTQ